MAMEGLCSAPSMPGPGQRKTGVIRPKRIGGRARATIALWVAIVAFTGGCGADASPEEVEQPDLHITAPEDASGIDEAEIPGALGMDPTTIPVTTYEGSGELVHPDVAFFPRGFWGVRYWFAATPYPHGDANFENPSIFDGSSSGEMRVPTGIANPLAKPEAGAYLSDPDITFDPDRQELRMYYRQTLPAEDQLYLIRSKDGASWSKSQLVIGAARYSLISPAVVREGTGKWRMWTVDARAAGCRSSGSMLSLQQRRSSDGVTWGMTEPVNLTIPGRVPWHWDVQYVHAKGEYWAMIAAYPDGTNCSLTSLYFARSVDGTTWSVAPSPLLTAGDFYPIRDLVYRSTFRYHEGSDAVSVWFSGARMEEGSFHYGVALARYPMDELLRRVNTAPAATLDRGEREHPSRELRAARAAFVADFP
jgi:hypothetical protein